jgi:hypothetical protein
LDDVNAIKNLNSDYNKFWGIFNSEVKQNIITSELMKARDLNNLTPKNHETFLTLQKFFDGEGFKKLENSTALMTELTFKKYSQLHTFTQTEMYKTLNESVYTGKVSSTTFKKVEKEFKEQQKLSDQITMFNKLIGKQHRLIGKAAQIFQIDEFAEETEQIYPGMIDWHEYYEEHHTALNSMTETLSKQIMKGAMDQIYNNQETAKTWDDFKNRADGRVLNLLSADLGTVEEVRHSIDNYAGKAANGLMKKCCLVLIRFRRTYRSRFHAKYT